jgi:hypothetical protein
MVKRYKLLVDAPTCELLPTKSGYALVSSRLIGAEEVEDWNIDGSGPVERKMVAKCPAKELLDESYILNWNEKAPAGNHCGPGHPSQKKPNNPS